MAEALGVFASDVAIAQVAGTAGTAVLKLKKLWDEVQDVPEAIQDLMEQIDCLDPALWEAERHLAQNDLPPMLWSDEAAVRSAAYCRKALTKLTELVDDLAVLMRATPDRNRRRDRVARRVACVKVVLRKDELAKLERRLETALRILLASRQGYILYIYHHLKLHLPVGAYVRHVLTQICDHGTLLKLHPDIIVDKLITQMKNNEL
jgi:hypothetical protein